MTVQKLLNNRFLVTVEGFDPRPLGDELNYVMW